MLGLRVSWLRASLMTLAGLLLASGVSWAHGGGHGGGGGGHGGGGFGGGVGHGGGMHAGGFGVGHHGVGGFGVGHHGVGGFGLAVGGLGNGFGVGRSGLGYGSGAFIVGGLNGVRSASPFYGPGFYRGLGYSPYFGRGYPYTFGYGLGLGYGANLGGYGRYGGAIGFAGGLGGFGLGYPFYSYNLSNGIGWPYFGYRTNWGSTIYPYSYYGYNATPSSSYSSAYPASPTEYGAARAQADMPPPPKDNMAHLLVIVPQNAQLWFNGSKTAQTGPEREFVSPELKPDKNYSYEVKARWKENGKDVEQVRTAHVKANDWMTVDFTKPEPAAKAEKK